jgi:hypothetical protein
MDIAFSGFWKFSVIIFLNILPSVGALLVSPLNVKWRCSAQAGGVEGSKFCLFLVVLPVMCISSVSPRFYFRRHFFCFLPLAAILESPILLFLHLLTCVYNGSICLGPSSLFLSSPAHPPFPPKSFHAYLFHTFGLPRDNKKDIAFLLV